MDDKNGYADVNTVNIEKYSHYFLSKFAHIFEKNDNYCLLHSLTLRKVYGNKVLKDIFTYFNKEKYIIDKKISRYHVESISAIIDDLISKGILINDHEIDVHTYTHYFTKGIARRPIQHVYFLPTSACNLRCKYCFIEDESRKQEATFMSIETAQKALDVFSHLSKETEQKEKISLTFYGGEPLLNAEVVYFSMKYVRKLEQSGKFIRKVDLSLLTNGTMVDSKTVEVLKETNSSVSVSLDGNADSHNAPRVDIHGKKSMHRILNGYYLLKDAGLNPGVSCTVHSGNIDHLPNIAKWIAEELQPNGMGFNILLPLIDAGNPLNIDPEYATQKIIESFLILRDFGIYEDRMMRRITPFIKKGFHFKDCMGVGGQLVVSPKGSVGLCQAFLGFEEFFPLKVSELHEKIPNLTTDDIYDHPLFDEWNHRFPLNMKECIDCPAIAVCGGGCPYAAYANHNSIWEIDERICSQTKPIMNWMIWDTFNHLIK